ncbi:MAG: enoyl-CoA hydratase-related protein [Actinomycetota bacterium]
MTDSEFETLTLERRDGHVLVVRIDRSASPLNAVDDQLHHELAELMALLKHEREARCIVLAGSGSAFSAGGDYHWFPSLQEPGRLEHLRQEGKSLIWDMLDVQIPIVAAVNGHAMGLGASIALLCDIVFVAESALIGDPHVDIGVVAGDGGTVIWPLAVGPARAKHYLLTGEPVDAVEAHRIGLANFVCGDDDCVERAIEYATRLAAKAPMAVQYTKLAINKLLKDAANSAFDVATALEIVTFHSDDHREALDAMAQKRPPVFTNR